MSPRPSDWEALNAYVDGELEPAAAADVADRIAHEPAVARRAAALTGMKAALADTSDAPAFNFDPPAKKAGYQWHWLSAAAAVIFIFAGFALWTTQLDRAHTGVVDRSSSGAYQLGGASARIPRLKPKRSL